MSYIRKEQTNEEPSCFGDRPRVADPSSLGRNRGYDLVFKSTPTSHSVIGDHPNTDSNANGNGDPDSYADAEGNDHCYGRADRCLGRFYP